MCPFEAQGLESISKIRAPVCLLLMRHCRRSTRNDNFRFARTLFHESVAFDFSFIFSSLIVRNHFVNSILVMFGFRFTAAAQEEL